MAKHERKPKARGGNTEDKEWDGKKGDVARDEAPSDAYAGASSHVAKEARGEMAHHEGEGREEDKRGGRAKRKAGGKAEEHEHRGTEGRHERKERKAGGHVMEVRGKGAKRRMDRPGRKRGGGVGADVTPLSSAARTHDRKDGDEAQVTGGV